MEGMSFGPKQLKSPLAGGPGQATGATEPVSSTQGRVPSGSLGAWAGVPTRGKQSYCRWRSKAESRPAGLSNAICHLCLQGHLPGLVPKTIPS